MQKLLAVVLFVVLIWAAAASEPLSGKPASPQGSTGSPWLIGGNSLPGTSSLGTTSNSDVSLMTNNVETARLYAADGITRLALTFNTEFPGTPFLPKNEAQLEIFGSPLGISYDQLALHGTSTTYRRSAITFESNCKAFILTNCVGNNNQWVQEFELGVDLAPNGGTTFSFSTKSPMKLGSLSAQRARSDSAPPGRSALYREKSPRRDITSGVRLPPALSATRATMRPAPWSPAPRIAPELCSLPPAPRRRPPAT